MSTEKKLRNNSAFAYCLKVLVVCVLLMVILLTATIYIMTAFSFSPETIQAHIGILFLVMLNIEVLCPLLITRQLVRPLDKLNRASSKLAQGNFAVDLAYDGKIAELETLFANMQEMTAELASVETLRADFVSNVSHEFKTPLTAIEGYATLIQNPDLTDGERAEYAACILNSTRRLSSLVSNILMLSRLENQRFAPEISTYRLDDQICRILLEQEPVWSARGIEFDMNLEETTYTGAEQLLYHVWANLINNAVKYSPDGGSIQVSLKREQAKIVFSIADQGPGIRPQDQKHIFEKFYQADTAHKKEGNGLGLAQVKKIADLLGGSVHVHSDGTHGSTFVVELPENAGQTPETP